MSSSPPPSAERFDDIDWDDTSPTGPELRRWNVGAFLVGSGSIAAGFLFDLFGTGELPAVAKMEPLDWLLAVSLLAIAVFVVTPLARNPGETRQYWNRLRKQPFGVASLLYIVLFFVIGLVGPLFVTEPTTLTFDRAYQPPIGTTVNTEWLIGSCVGVVTNGHCHGTWQYPLGTTLGGKDMVPLIVLGARTSLAVALVSGTLIVPTGTAVGLVAAFSGGRTDRVLMSLAEVLQTVPAVIIYMLFWQWNAEYRLLMLIGVFGLTSWGGLARLVRNEALQRREVLYVQAAMSAGADESQIMRWHLLPNISGSVLTNVTLQIPMLVLTEAALSFIVLPTLGSGTATLGDPTVVSWGQTIYVGIRNAGFFPGWWITIVPSIMLILTVLSFSLLGRALSDVLDPRPR